jgi:hypothetical protein
MREIQPVPDLDLNGEAWHIDCGNCGADVYVAGANRFPSRREEWDDDPGAAEAQPTRCPFCGAEEDGSTLYISGVDTDV